MSGELSFEDMPLEDLYNLKSDIDNEIYNKELEENKALDQVIARVSSADINDLQGMMSIISSGTLAKITTTLPCTVHMPVWNGARRLLDIEKDNLESEANSKLFSSKICEKWQDVDVFEEVENNIWSHKEINEAAEFLRKYVHALLKRADTLCERYDITREELFVAAGLITYSNIHDDHYYE
jgi:hypothetical protein